MATIFKASQAIVENTAQAAANATKAVSEATNAAAKLTESTGEAADAALKATTTGIQVASKVTAASGNTAVAAIDTATTSAQTINSLLVNTNEATSHMFNTINGSLKGLAPAGENVTKLVSETIGNASKLTTAITNILMVPVNRINANFEQTPERMFEESKKAFMANFNKNTKVIIEISNSQLQNLIDMFKKMVDSYKEDNCQRRFFLRNCSSVGDVIIKLNRLNDYIKGEKNKVITFMKNKFREMDMFQRGLSVTSKEDIETKLNQLKEKQTEVINESTTMLQNTIMNINKSVGYIQKQLDEKVNAILDETPPPPQTLPPPPPIETGGRRRRKSIKKAKRSKRSTKRPVKKSKRTRTRKY
jgi:hypothetical protein